MDLNNEKYAKFALCREMAETPDVLLRGDEGAIAAFSRYIDGDRRFLLTGEGSSRIFPAKRLLAELRRRNSPLDVFTEGATQALEYAFDDVTVIGASNSGRTKEVIRLFRTLASKGHGKRAGITAHRGSPLEEASGFTHLLESGDEKAVAATKTVAEQAMVYESLFRRHEGIEEMDRIAVSQGIRTALEIPVAAEYAERMANASTVYFAGRNDGVAEELALKTNEVVRKRSAFLEGTFAAHGIEEVMTSDDILIVVDPFPEEEEKFSDCLEKGVGMTIIALSGRETRFPTIRLPSIEMGNEWIQLAGGWNLLVEAGLAAGIDLDKPERARKVGNEI